MRGEPLGPPVPPRELDRYPETVVVDFRRCDLKTLKKYCVRFEIDLLPSMQIADMAAAVARHFQKDLPIVNEEATLQAFCDNSFSFAGGNTIEDIKARTGRRLRSRKFHRTRIGAVGSDEEEGEAVVDTDPSTVVYCVCKKGAYGEMLSCDNAETGTCIGGDWFHYSCVGFGPDDKIPELWYCPACEKRSQNDQTRKRRNTGKKRGALSAE